MYHHTESSTTLGSLQTRPMGRPHSDDSARAFDLDLALTKFSGDLTLVLLAAEIYCENSPLLIEAIFASTMRSDAVGLRLAAHTLWCASDILGAAQVRELAFTLEAACQYFDPEALVAVVEECAYENSRLRAELRSFLAEGPGRPAA